MKLTSLLAALALSASALPAVAVADHHGPATGHTLTHDEEVKLAACRKMKPEDAKHDPVCVKLMASHPETHK